MDISFLFAVVDRPAHPFFFTDLNTVWFLLVGILLTGYAILDGFDLGVGILHPFIKGDTNRRLFLNSIGPVWDGNEVWLVTGGGALFAAFPIVYATVFSGFYMAFMLLLVALIFRAVSIEFRSKMTSGAWRSLWDACFFTGSFLAALLIGVAMGNIAMGIPLNAEGDYTGSFFDLLHPYALLLGVTTVALFAMHGCIYLTMKTEGELHEVLRRWVNRTIILFGLCYFLTSVATLTFLPHMTERFMDYPVLFILAILNLLAVLNVPREFSKQRDFRAFFFSCLSMVFLMLLFALSVYPNMVRSSIQPENSLTIYNAASSEKTLRVMLTIAGIGVPIVLTYTVCIYRIFRGKTKLNEHSY